MKNRLEVAREFLSDDGAIFIQCDYNESHYLKVLMDEIFSVSNFRNEIIWKRSQNISSINDVFKRAHDTILFCSNSNSFELTRLFREHEESYLKQYDKYDEIGQYRHVPLLVSGKRTGVTGKIWRGIDPNIYGKNGMHWLTTHEKLEKLDSERLIYWPKNGGQPMRKYYLKDSDGRQVDSIWDDIKLVTPSSKEGLGFIGQKPEELLQRIIEASTNPKDLVMDFHLGSGTTCAVAHKMRRRYIGIEQMDYIEDIAVERLKKVIDGEQGGISKAVNWSGGGSFVYAALKQIDNFKNSEIASLNKNMQYLPIDEIEDEDYGITKEEIAINRAFYGIENE
jgi:adenine-specific DNA-methyltransferase